ncbi:RND family transporter [Mycolicibacterium tokaiense]|uniref:Transmembrane transport protein MmpL4_5 n=1 Tax=Mycolicibacterium tokaiense TaxID=39695 RepID=A0A378TNB4_9MYCO|nr:RND family transporter [Mycolicibacterium tokaiense]BBY89558.1 putative membrane protein, mmpL [Mycolicibacterium tokaiense]STZ62054.1 transmembrane transport protein MmpL4_5 [Mycolicibacterium tokaiense]
MRRPHAAVDAQPSGPARWIRRLAVPIILFWVAMVAVAGLFIPPLEEVAAANSVPLNPADAPSLQAMQQMGEVFGESNSDSIALVVLEGVEPLGDEAHAYYDELIERLRADPDHVQNVQDFWGDPLTESGAQSTDGRAAYVQLFLAGNMGETLANESVQAVRDAVAAAPAPDGVTVYVTGPAALQADLQLAGERTVVLITVVTFSVIIVLLLFFYRSIVTVVIGLVVVGIQLGAASAVVGGLGHFQVIGLSTFAVNLVVAMAIAAGTDYVVFLLGRYQEARAAGVDPEAAYYEMFRGTAHVILGSALTIAGAAFCLSLTRMPYFQSLGVPCAVGMLVAVVVALTLGPAVITVASRFGLLEPKRAMRIRFWRRIGTSVVRWPLPILLASLAVALVGLAALPFYQPSYDDRQFIPQDIPSNQGYLAADEHFSAARMNPDVLLIEADHDLRNSADFLVLDKVAKAVFRVEGISRVQAPTRPQGTPIENTSIPFMISMQGVGMAQNMEFMFDRLDDMKRQAEDLGNTITIMQNMQNIMTRMSGITDDMLTDVGDLQETAKTLRDSMANFDDFFRPIRNYFYWEPKCFNIPLCWSLRGVFDGLDGISIITDQMDRMISGFEDMNALFPEMLAQFPAMIATMQNMQQMMLTMHSTMYGMYSAMDEAGEGATEMGRAFDAAKNDDSFYLPPEVFENEDFRRAMDLFVSPDGTSVRMIISHRGDPATSEGISRVEPIQVAAIEAIKGTPLEDARVSLGGMAATYKDLAEGSRYDLLIAAIASVCLIFAVMLLVTRSLIAAMVIVGTVLTSLGASFGLSVLLWQYIIGLPLHWMVVPMAVIVLLAVGADYNLMMVARFKEELPGGIKTGIIRAMGGTGSVVTIAGVVFSFTMASLVVSDLRTIGQMGTMIGIGLLFDTLIVRSFMVPSIAALLGRWFWWPLNPPTRPARQRATSLTA